jgi:hypothetical protein
MAHGAEASEAAKTTRLSGEMTTLDESTMSSLAGI